MKPQKKGLYYKIGEKTDLAHEFCGDNQVSWESQASNCTSVEVSLLFSLGHNPRLGGHNSRLGGTSSDLGEHGPGIPPVASGLLQVYSNSSNCNYRIFVKKILHKIGFIEEMRTI